MMNQAKNSRDRKNASYKTPKRKKASRLPIYFNTSRESIVIISLNPLRTCTFSHNWATT